MSRARAITFGDRLRKLREELGLSLRKAAAKAEISPTYLSQLERDLSKPSENVLSSLAVALEQGQDELFAMAGLVATDVQDIILKNPGEICALILAIDGLPVEEIEALTQHAEDLRIKLGLPSLDGQDI